MMARLKLATSSGRGSPGDAENDTASESGSLSKLTLIGEFRCAAAPNRGKARAPQAAPQTAYFPLISPPSGTTQW